MEEEGEEDADLSLFWQVAVCILLDELKQFRPLDRRELVFSHSSHQLDDCLAHGLPATRGLQLTGVMRAAQVMQSTINSISPIIMFIT